MKEIARKVRTNNRTNLKKVQESLAALKKAGRVSSRVDESGETLYFTERQER